MQMIEAPRLVSIPFAAKHAGVPERTFRRRMHAMNYIADGRLLIPANPRQLQRVGKWLVCLAVLEEVAPTRAKARAATVGELEDIESELAETKNKLSALEGRANGHAARLRQHGKLLKKHQALMNSIQATQKALAKTDALMAGIEESNENSGH